LEGRAMAEDRRRYPCPVCGRAVVQIGRQCGLCRSFCTEARVREVEAARQRTALPVHTRPAKGGELQCRLAL